MKVDPAFSESDATRNVRWILAPPRPPATRVRYVPNRTTTPPAATAAPAASIASRLRPVFLLAVGRY